MMIAPNYDFENDWDLELELELAPKAGRTDPPLNERLFLARKIDRTGREKLANQSRFRRGTGSAKLVNGPHKRREKRGFR